MGAIQEYKICECGNPNRVNVYNYKTEEVNEFCDLCGYFKEIKINNRPENGKYPPDWQPRYEKIEGKTGFIAKVFVKGAVGCTVACIEKKDVSEILMSLNKDSDVEKFAITFKDKEGNFQTQIYDKTRNKKNGKEGK